VGNGGGLDSFYGSWGSKGVKTPGHCAGTQKPDPRLTDTKSPWTRNVKTRKAQGRQQTKETTRKGVRSERRRAAQERWVRAQKAWGAPMPLLKRGGQPKGPVGTGRGKYAVIVQGGWGPGENGRGCVGHREGKSGGRRVSRDRAKGITWQSKWRKKGGGPWKQKKSGVAPRKFLQKKEMVERMARDWGGEGGKRGVDA